MCSLKCIYLFHQLETNVKATEEKDELYGHTFSPMLKR